MRWHNRYELLEPIAGAPGTFRGRENSSNNPVILHQFPVHDCSFPNSVLREIDELPPHASEHVRDIWEFEGALYVVTDLHFGEVVLTEWLERARGAPGSSQALPSEFTRFFLAPAALRDPAPEIAQRVRSTGPRPGEFTRFMSSSLAPESAMPAAQPVGELTRLFQAKVEAEPRALESSNVPPVAPPPAPQPPLRPVGDFTRLLGPMVGSPAVPSQESAPQQKAPAASIAPSLPTARPGDYTRVVAARRPDPVIPAAPMSAQMAAIPPKTRGSLTPILVFSGLAMLALSLIAAFAFWR